MSVCTPLQNPIYSGTFEEKEKILYFEKPIIGFEEFLNFRFSDIECEKIPFSLKKLTSIDHTISFLVTQRFNGMYHPQDIERILKSLKLSLSDVELYTIVTLVIQNSVLDFSINLKAPIVIDRTLQKSYQIVLEGDFYPLELKF